MMDPALQSWHASQDDGSGGGANTFLWMMPNDYAVNVLPMSELNFEAFLRRILPLDATKCWFECKFEMIPFISILIDVFSKNLHGDMIQAAGMASDAGMVGGESVSHAAAPDTVSTDDHGRAVSAAPSQEL